MDDPNINKLLVLKIARTNPSDQFMFVNFIVPYPFLLVYNQKILQQVDFSLFLVIALPELYCNYFTVNIIQCMIMILDKEIIFIYITWAYLKSAPHLVLVFTIYTSLFTIEMVAQFI